MQTPVRRVDEFFPLRKLSLIAISSTQRNDKSNALLGEGGNKFDLKAIK